MIKIYGIKNCDAIKKSLKWLEAKDIAYDFHDYKKEGVDEAVLQKALEEHGWENVINRRGTTWRKLPKETQDSMDNANAVIIAHETPSIIKRPLMLRKNEIHLGFKEDTYSKIFGI